MSPRLTLLARGATLGLALAAAATVASSQPARACTAEIPLFRSDVLPPPDATAVPTNTEIRVTYGNSGSEFHAGLAQIELREVGGDAVELDVEVFDAGGSTLVVARTKAPLTASTSYELLDRVPEDAQPCFEGAACLEDTGAVFATFETGAGADTTPPTFAGLQSTDSSHDVCEGDACCGPYDALIVSLDFTDATDDGPEGTVRYNVYRSGEADPVARSTKFPHGVSTCSGTGFREASAQAFTATTGSYLVRALDLAGNEDTNTAEVAVTVDCGAAPDPGPETGPEPGPEQAVEQGPDPDPPSSSGGDDGGCTGGPAGAPIGLALLILLALAVRRERAAPAR